MPTPLDALTKPFQIGARAVLGAVQGVHGAVRGLVGRGQGKEPAPERPPASARSRPAPKQLDDKTITAKVETVLFRDDAVEKGRIDVNTADGVVWLRGQAKNPGQIKELEARARAIPEVRGVENLLHLPKTPAPSRTRRTSKPKAKPPAAARKPAPKRVSAERKATTGEPSPEQAAKAGEGRRPAPLGSSDDGG